MHKKDDEKDDEKDHEEYVYRVSKKFPLKTKHAARWLGFSVRQLEKLRKLGEGPESYMRGPNFGRAFYEFDVLEAFMPGGAQCNRTTAQAAALLKRSIRTLESLRKKKQGPPYKVFCKKFVRYPLEGLSAYEKKEDNDKEQKQ